MVKLEDGIWLDNFPVESSPITKEYKEKMRRR
jgi:hypothetical protein